MARQRKVEDPLLPIDLSPIGAAPWPTGDARRRRWRQITKDEAPWLRSRDRAVLIRLIEAERQISIADQKIEGWMEDGGLSKDAMGLLIAIKGKNQQMFSTCAAALGMSPASWDKIKDANRSAVPPPREETDPLEEFE